jgi:hypothetical protein
MRHKGQQQLPKTLHTDASVIAHQMKTGDNWFYAWLSQMGTPYVKLTRLTGMSAARFLAIEHGDRVSRPELDALAKAWGATPEALIASMPDPSIVVD